MDINKIKGVASELFSKIKRDERSFLEKGAEGIESLKTKRKIIVIKELIRPKGPTSQEYLAINKKIDTATKEYNEFAAKQKAAQTKFEELNKK